MSRVEYDAVAPTFDNRYAGQNYDQTTDAVRRFIGTVSRRSVLEVGCGTGHWLDVIRGDAALLVGVDRSLGMLRRAQKPASPALLVQGTAELLPLRAQLFDRVLCVNALHHFPDPEGFVAECRRVLRPGGSFLTIGLDPHNGRDHGGCTTISPRRGRRTSDATSRPSAFAPC